MSFINEYVSEEDIQTYQLDDLINNVLNISQRAMRMPERRLKGYKDIYWTIDKTTHTWLIFMKSIYSYEDSSSGRPEPTRERVFCFFWSAQVYEVSIFLSEKSSLSLSDNPYFRVWEKPLVIKPEIELEKKQLFLTALKQALTVYGNDGVKWQVPNTVVLFDF